MAKQKTHEQFVKEMSQINNNISIISTYKGSKLKVLCNCKVDNYEWEVSPSHLLRGQACPECKGLKRRTHDEFINDLYKINKNIQILSNFSGVMKPIECKCLIDENVWTTLPSRLLLGNGCPVCAIRSMSNGKALTHDDFVKKVNEISPNIKILGHYHRANQRIKCKCLIDGHEWSPYASRLQSSGCPVCSGMSIKQGINDIWTTNPQLANLLLDPSDGYKFTQASNKKTNFKCQDCGTIYTKQISDVRYHGLSCSNCSDGYSIPNKFMSQILSSLQIDFISEASFDWSDGKRYDFYLREHKVIIEMHGKQHYDERGFRSLGGRTLEEEQRNDTYKLHLAIENGIENYIIVDCRDTSFDYMKTSLDNSPLNKIIDLDKVDLKKCFINALTSKLVETCNLWSSGKDKKSILNELHISNATYYTYLNTGAELGLCDYKSQHRKKIICLNTTEVFDSISEAHKKYNTSHICDCCKNLRQYSGKHPVTKEPLKWMYYDEYLLNSKSIS